jgi:hypothetical protein
VFCNTEGKQEIKKSLERAIRTLGDKKVVSACVRLASCD